jgi:hypothetical protein
MRELKEKKTITITEVVKVKLYIFILAFLLLAPLATADAAIIAATTAASTATLSSSSEGSNYNCVIPMQFAINNNCDLQECSSLGTFRCGNYRIKTDCKGEVLGVEEVPYTDLTKALEMGLIVLIVLLVVLGLLIGFSKLGYDDYEYKKSFKERFKEKW